MFSLIRVDVLRPQSWRTQSVIVGRVLASPYGRVAFRPKAPASGHEHLSDSEHRMQCIVSGLDPDCTIDRIVQLGSGHVMSDVSNVGRIRRPNEEKLSRHVDLTVKDRTGHERLLQCTCAHAHLSNNVHHPKGMVGTNMGRNCKEALVFRFIDRLEEFQTELSDHE